MKPGPMFSQIKQGNIVVFNGEELNPGDFVGPPIPGREIVIFGDTCNSDEILNFTKSPDMFVHESTMENSLEVKCKEYGHSTPDMAADIAIRSKAKHLVLFHLSPRYKPITECSEEESDSANILLKEARDYITSKQEKLDVSIAQDFMSIDLRH